MLPLYAPNARVLAVDCEGQNEARIRQLNEEVQRLKLTNKRLVDDKASLAQQVAFLNKEMVPSTPAKHTHTGAYTAALVDVHATLPLQDLSVALYHVLRVPKVRAVAQCQSRDVLLMSIEDSKTGRAGVLKMSLLGTI